MMHAITVFQSTPPQGGDAEAFESIGTVIHFNPHHRKVVTANLYKNFFY